MPSTHRPPTEYPRLNPPIYQVYDHYPHANLLQGDTFGIQFLKMDLHHGMKAW